MRSVVEWKGVRDKVSNHLVLALGAEYVEKTSRTKDLGKWLIVVDSEQFQKTRDLTNRILGEMKEFLEGETLGGNMYLEIPWRTGRSIESHQYEDYLKKLDEVLPTKQEARTPLIKERKVS